MSRDIDARVDLYATGVLMYEMLTGRVPYDATSIAEVVAAVLRDEMPSVRKLRPEVPVQIAEVVTKATAKDKAKRYASAERMKIALVSAVRASNSSRERHSSPMTDSHPQYV